MMTVAQAKQTIAELGNQQVRTHQETARLREALNVLAGSFTIPPATLLAVKPPNQ